MRKHVWNKVLSVLLAFALVLTNFLSFGNAQLTVQAEETVITVAQAIANNTGVATVEGFIVGTTSVGPNYQLSGPFTVPSNLAIADSPNETAKANIMPVQLVSGTAVRNALNLVDHPENLGAKVRITGTLSAYFTTPGLKTPTAYTIVDGGVVIDPPPGPQEMSIADARAKTGQTVIVEGVVTADNAALGGYKISTYIQDGTAGINLYASSATGFPELKEGDKVRVTGKITEYKGLLEIEPSQAADVQVVSSGNTLPAVTTLSSLEALTTAAGEVYEGTLVKVTAYAASVPSSASGGGYNVAIYDGAFNSTTLRVMETTGAISQIQAGKWYEFTAIVGQYDSYQLMPRKASDIKLAAEQPGAPRPADRYASSIKSTVDGDTAHLNTPVLGATTVRMLSIDTPETNYEGMSQGFHGEQAKLKLKELLPVGTPVEIEPADQPFDSYGRLLAHIHVGEMDINKEMVRLGMAVPYFIWPNVEHFEEYAAATREAMQNERGIWDPQNPLEQLPYEFRFTDRGGPDKYVGDFYTKKFVSPDKWEEVPVENRVFFYSTEEALSAGYTYAETMQPNVQVQLLSINDLHGKIDQSYEADFNGDRVNDGWFGRMDYVATYLKNREATNPNTLLIHAGDAVGGSSPVSALFQDEPTIEILENLGFDAGTIGNHELDEGTAEMLRLQNGGDHPNGTENYDGINFPHVAANVVYKATGEHVLDPYVIKEVGGEKIGFIGVVTKSAAGMVMPAGIQDIEFTDETAAVNAAVAELKAQGIKAIVVMAHMDAVQSGTKVTGPAADLANKVDDEVDVIFAAHNHLIVNGVVDNKLIVQAWEYGKAIADVDLEISPATHDIVAKRGEIVPVAQAGVTPDPAVTEILNKYQNRIAPIINQVVGEAEQQMLGGYGVKGLIGDNALGNLIADSMSFAMDSDFALMNGGGIRDNLQAGPITWGELYNILPFNNVLMKLEVTGADMFKILDAQLSKQYGPDFSVGGFSYTYDSETVKTVDIFLPDGSKIDPAKTYTLAVNNFMATSTSAKYKPMGQLGKNPVTGPEDLEALVAFVKNSTAPFAYEADARISDVREIAANTIGELSIADARLAGTGKVVTVQGTVTSKTGIFGEKRFYVQDATGGLFVLQNRTDLEVGDVVRVTGITAENGGEFRLIGVTAIETVGTAVVPEHVNVTPGTVNEALEGEIVKLKKVIVSDLTQTNTFGSASFTATLDGQSITVLIDSRIGANVASLHFENSAALDVIGIASEVNGSYVVKLRSLNDVKVFNPNAGFGSAKKGK
ncbi:hypothetical protein CBW65_03325 [Tumebacillus avium]|uniref:TNase-like domain-containing protein n=1 Tax=Tumebacillus avium TaxID=1903704 RepID=A0A1Y0ILG3_9BACL|nr:DUF6359 domain-containing protein [Tumebacillus avium]ARU60194.1 hypothetical protein CBW65_03325 [Tumebacillus avium]